MNSWSRRLARRNSCEQSVEIPFRIGLFFEQPVAEDPEAPAPRIFDAIIIAGQTGIIDCSILTPPPFGRDPFGPLEPAHLMKFAAPAEAVRWAVGNRSHDFDRLRRIEQVKRPERRGFGCGDR